MQGGMSARGKTSEQAWFGTLGTEDPESTLPILRVNQQHVFTAENCASGIGGTGKQ
jgi:hypothetical protein